MLRPDLLMCGALVFVSVLDCKKRWIPNTVTIPLVLVGLAAAWMSGSSPGLKQSATGLAFLFALFALGREFGVARGGDTKLAAGVGAWLGFDRAYSFILVWVALNGIAFLIVSRRAYGSWAAWWQDQRVSLEGLRVGLLHRQGSVSYPGAVTISLAAVVALYLPVLKEVM